MNIFDAHCDVIWKLWEKKCQVSFKNDNNLHVTLHKLKQANAKIQCFAIYVPEKVPMEQRFDTVLEMIEIFYREILDKHPEMKLITTKHDSQILKDGEIGALLSLEGCDAIGTNIARLRILHRLGVRSVGLTWNYSNPVADGVLESRGAGLSNFGKKVVKTLNEYHLWTDVSHLSEKGFWDVMDLAHHPIASHSNALSLHHHPRNLTDEQIKALVLKDGMIGITFYPPFITDTKPAQITHILRHVDYVCSLGGEKSIGFGSDFDGIDETVEQLDSYADYQNLVNELLKYYKEEQVKGFLFSNFLDHISF